MQRLSLSIRPTLIAPILAVGMFGAYFIPLRHIILAIEQAITDNTLSLWSEWEMVINYEAGWIRRGLIGSIINWGWDTTTSLNIYPIFGLIAMIVAVILVLIVFWRLSRDPITTLTLFLASPFLAWLIIWDFEGFVFRKDYYVYCALLMHGLMVNTNRSSIRSDLIIIVFIVGATLIHEMTFFTLVAHWLIHVRGDVVRAIALRRPSLVELGLVLAAILGIAGVLVPIDKGDIEVICSALPNSFFDNCIASGPMLSMLKPSGYFFSDPTTNPFNSLFHWILIGLLWVGNLAIIYSSISNYRLIGVSFITILLVGIVTFLPLMALAIDWGRWLGLGFVASLALMVASINPNRAIKKPSERAQWRQLFALSALFLVALTLRIPHCCSINSDTLFTPIWQKVPLSSFSN